MSCRTKKPFPSSSCLCPAEPASGHGLGAAPWSPGREMGSQTGNPHNRGVGPPGLWTLVGVQRDEAAPQDSRKQMDLERRVEGARLEDPYSSPDPGPSCVTQQCITLLPVLQEGVGALRHPMALST